MHCLSDKDVKSYLKLLGRALGEGGQLNLLCVRESPQDAGMWPYAYQEDELRRLFSHGWRVESIVDALDYSTMSDAGFAALLLMAVKIS